MYEAVFRFSYPDSTVARTVERSLALEADAIQGDRSSTCVDREDATVLVRIDADDPRALRAAKNTWFSLVSAAEETVALVE